MMQLTLKMILQVVYENCFNVSNDLLGVIRKTVIGNDLLYTFSVIFGLYVT